MLASPNHPVLFIIATVNALAKMVPSLSRNRLVDTVQPTLQQCIMRYFKDPPVALALLSKGRGREMCEHVCVCPCTGAVFCVLYGKFYTTSGRIPFSLSPQSPLSPLFSNLTSLVCFLKVRMTPCREPAYLP